MYLGRLLYYIIVYLCLNHVANRHKPTITGNFPQPIFMVILRRRQVRKSGAGCYNRRTLGASFWMSIFIHVSWDG